VLHAVHIAMVTKDILQVAMPIMQGLRAIMVEHMEIMTDGMVTKAGIFIQLMEDITLIMVLLITALLITVTITIILDTIIIIQLVIISIIITILQQ